MRRLHVLMLSLLALFPANAHAAYVIDVIQSGANVVATGSGSIDTSALNGPLLLGSGSYVDASIGQMVIGSGSVSAYFGTMSSTTDFGPGGFFLAGTSTGSAVGFDFVDAFVAVPDSYHGGSLGTSTSVFANQTLASLGLTPGQYVMTWGSGQFADGLTLNVTGTPEPGTWVLMMLGFGAIGVMLRRRTRAAAGYA